MQKYTIYNEIDDTIYEGTPLFDTHNEALEWMNQNDGRPSSRVARAFVSLELHNKNNGVADSDMVAEKYKALERRMAKEGCEHGACPNCGSHALDYDIQQQVDDNCVYYPVRCESCDCRFDEYYELNYSSQEDIRLH
jgi:hypothetical protein